MNPTSEPNFMEIEAGKVKNWKNFGWSEMVWPPDNSDYGWKTETDCKVLNFYVWRAL